MPVTFRRVNHIFLSLLFSFSNQLDAALRGQLLPVHDSTLKEHPATHRSNMAGRYKYGSKKKVYLCLSSASTH